MKPLLGPNVAIDVDRLVVSRLLLQANSGGGKSWALRRLLEQTHGKVQHLVLDIEGEFHTLRERFDYVLAARTGGDTLADVRSAGVLARRLLELGVSAIVDLYELKAHDRIRFVRLFLEALIDAPRSLWHPALVVVDEAHHFCPQAGQAESAAAVIDLMTRGRKRGFCGVLATQRLSKLHKDAAAEANCKLIGRATLDVDLKRAADELGFSSREDVARIRALPPGRFFAMGPGLSDQVVEVQVGDVVTTHPRAGRGNAPVPPPREKVQKVLAQLADLPKQADEEIRTLQQAQAEVVKLRRELAAKPAAPSPQVERVEVPVLKDSQLRRVEVLAEKAAAVSAVMAAAAEQLRGMLPARTPTPPGAVRPAPKATQAEPRRVAPAAAGDGDPITGPEQRILDAIAWLEATNQQQAQDQAAVAFLAGYTVGGGAFNNPRGRLNTRGLIEYRGGNLALTDAGRAAAAVPSEVLTSAELHERVLARLPGPEARILRVLLVAYPDDVENDELARAAGYEPGGGAFNNPRGRLRSLGLVTTRRRAASRRRRRCSSTGGADDDDQDRVVRPGLYAIPVLCRTSRRRRRMLALDRRQVQGQGLRPVSGRREEDARAPGVVGDPLWADPGWHARLPPLRHAGLRAT
ncbi:MAG: DUF87 domain-containing protein [Planctomycetes bacterium]|nr:DUF87 domain-containing protein [Planctomycetota bacterium]